MFKITIRSAIANLAYCTATFAWSSYLAGTPFTLAAIVICLFFTLFLAVDWKGMAEKERHKRLAKAKIINQKIEDTTSRGK